MEAEKAVTHNLVVNTNRDKEQRKYITYNIGFGKSVRDKQQYPWSQ